MKGEELVKLLGISPGPSFGLVMRKVMEWQILNTRGTKEELQKYLQAEFPRQ